MLFNNLFMSDRWNCFRASCSCSCRGGHEHGHRSAMRGIYPQIATSFSLRNFPKVTTKFFAPNSQKSKCQLRRYDDQCINSNKDMFGNAKVINPTEIIAGMCQPIDSELCSCLSHCFYPISRKRFFSKGRKNETSD